MAMAFPAYDILCNSDVFWSAGKGKSRRGAHDFRGEAAKHGDPSRIEDIFPMALTYMSDPKEAPARKIISYINKYYPEVDTSDRYGKSTSRTSKVEFSLALHSTNVEQNIS